jgi:hypothetical protein
MKLCKADGSCLRELAKLARKRLLILVDFGLEVLDASSRLILLEILEYRHGRASTLLTSQLPMAQWHSAIGDRIVHTAHRLDLKGESGCKLYAHQAEDKGKPAHASVAGGENLQQAGGVRETCPPPGPTMHYRGPCRIPLPPERQMSATMGSARRSHAHRRKGEEKRPGQLTEKSYCDMVGMRGFGEGESGFLFRNKWLFSAECASMSSNLIPLSFRAA